MTEEKKTGGNGFLLGAVIGAAVGAVSALLLAPKAGKELRKDISDTAHTAGAKTKELAGAAGDKAKEAAKQVKETAGDLGGKVKETAIHAAEAASAVKDNVQSWVKDLRAPSMIDITETRTVEPVLASVEPPTEEAPVEQSPEAEEPKAAE
ncbi:YtxH domain-containing protein [Gorillibacterium timonense]|uniref:YtxH domain-containing protein n=1 Tax=Gorillibacterium timonense TaxID=1689269 RepID=UPI00131B2488|nr:YtxH domain-containing protein [Gorillibacterium timonense]